jgi:hypothetical protein
VNLYYTLIEKTKLCKMTDLSKESENKSNVFVEEIDQNEQITLSS